MEGREERIEVHGGGGAGDDVSKSGDDDGEFLVVGEAARLRQKRVLGGWGSGGEFGSLEGVLHAACCRVCR